MGGNLQYWVVHELPWRSLVGKQWARHSAGSLAWLVLKISGLEETLQANLSLLGSQCVVGQGSSVA